MCLSNTVAYMNKFAILAMLAMYIPYGHVQRQYQYARYGYPGKEGINIILTMLISAQSGIPLWANFAF